MFSLRQMEQSVIDVQKIEEETKEKIAAVNSQKVTIVTAFIAQMKVRIIELGTEDLNMTSLHFVSARMTFIFLIFF